MQMDIQKSVAFNDVRSFPGASLFVIVLHAVMYSTTDEAIPFVDLEMETV